MKVKLILIIASLFNIALSAQEITRSVIASGGTVITNGELAISSTVGELVINTLKDNNVVVTQGFQQSGLTVTSIHTVARYDLKINAYPNPVVDMLTIDISMDAYQSKYWQVDLVDVRGRKILSQDINHSKSLLELSGVGSGVYFVLILQNDELVATAKVYKR